MTKTFFTSDLHFGHANLIKYCNRPFNSVEDMDEAMIRNWNDRVGQNDTSYILGDFAMGRTAIPQILARLNGNKHFIWGNHDSKQTRELPQWASSQPYLEINLDKTFIVLCHYAMKVWNRSHKGALMFYGHSHNSLTGNDQSCDVGVDAFGYKPVTLEEIKRHLKTLPPYKSADYHGEP